MHQDSLLKMLPMETVCTYMVTALNGTAQCPFLKQEEMKSERFANTRIRGDGVHKSQANTGAALVIFQHLKTLESPCSKKNRQDLP